MTIIDDGFLDCHCSEGIRIGSDTSIDRNCWVSAGGRAGDPGYLSVRRGSYIETHAGRHLFSDPARDIFEQGVAYWEVVLENGAWIGSKVTILGRVTAGRGAFVTRPVPPLTIAAGVPPRLGGRRGGAGYANRDLP